MTWMARLNRVFGIDLSVCPKCGGKLRVIGEVTEPKAIARILEHAKQRGRHERDPRAPPLLLASLFHLQHIRPALSQSSTTTPIPHASANTLAQPQFSPLFLLSPFSSERRALTRSLRAFYNTLQRESEYELN